MPPLLRDIAEVWRKHGNQENPGGRLASANSSAGLLRARFGRRKTKQTPTGLRAGMAVIGSSLSAGGGTYAGILVHAVVVRQLAVVREGRFAYAHGAFTNNWGTELQDRHYTRRGIFLVADGLGGYTGGARAAELGIQGFVRQYRSLRERGAPMEVAVREGIQSANAAIRYEKERDLLDASAATTLTGLCIDPDTLEGAAIGIGDSNLDEVTPDGSREARAPVQENDEGEITNVLDGEPRPAHTDDPLLEEDFVRMAQFKPGMRFLVMSDGVTRNQGPNLAHPGLTPIQAKATEKAILRQPDPLQALSDLMVLGGVPRQEDDATGILGTIL
jgi:hypothetical protein